MKKINVGLIGAGRIGRLHAENIAAIPYAQIKAVSETDPGMGRPDGNSEVTSNVQDVLKDPEINAVFIFQPRTHSN